MLLQTAAIEAARKKPGCVFAALQPGTVQSKLSSGFVASENAMLPEEAVSKMMAVMSDLKPNGRAQYVDHAGQVIPW